MEEVKKIFANWEEELSAKQKKNIHFHSMRNFAIYYDLLPNERIKTKVATVLNEYTQEVQVNGFNYKGIDSYELATKYMNKISDFYSTHLGFKSFIAFRFTVIFGILGDVLVNLLFYSYLNFPLPLCLSCFLAYYFYAKCLYEKKKKLFGIFY